MNVPFEGVFDIAVAHGQAIVERMHEATRRRAADYTYGWRTARDLLQVAGSGTTLWLLHKHKRMALPVSVATSAVTAGLTAVSAIFDPDPVSQEDLTEAERLRNKIVNGITDCLSSVIGTATLFFSSDAKNILVEPMDLTPRNPEIPFTTLEQVRNVTSLYATYTLVGHWLEMLFCQLIRLGVVSGGYDRSNTMLWDWWLHPFPAEGIAGVMIAGVLTPLREVFLKLFGGRIIPALAASFLVSQVVCTSIDYLTGMVANRNYELWDYRDMRFNFMGQICLQNSLAYSIAATWGVWKLLPALEKLMAKAGNTVLDGVLVGLGSAFIFLELLYQAVPPKRLTP
jgi:hypothetical protein